MSQAQAPRVLLVDDDDGVRGAVQAALEYKGMHVVSAGNVVQALSHISNDSFDALVTDLHMPNPGDGFTVISAMRHSHPHALTFLVSGYPDVQTALSTIALEADRILVKPVKASYLDELIRDSLRERVPPAKLKKERVSDTLSRCSTQIIRDWLALVHESENLSSLELIDAERTGHLSKLLEELILRLRSPQGTDPALPLLPQSYRAGYGSSNDIQLRCWCKNQERSRLFFLRLCKPTFAFSTSA